MGRTEASKEEENGHIGGWIEVGKQHGGMFLVQEVCNKPIEGAIAMHSFIQRRGAATHEGIAIVKYATRKNEDARRGEGKNDKYLTQPRALVPLGISHNHSTYKIHYYSDSGSGRCSE